MQINVALRYGQALFELADERNVLERIADDIGVIDSVLSRIPELFNCFSNPAIKTSKLKNILKKAFKPIIHEITWEFLKVLANQKRLYTLKIIPRIFHNLYNDHCGIVDVTIEGVYRLSHDEKEALIRKLEMITEKKVHLDFKLNTQLLAGFKLYIGENLMDCSISGKLQRLRNRMLAA